MGRLRLASPMPACINPRSTMADIRRYYIEINKGTGGNRGIHVFARSGCEAAVLAAQRNPGFRVVYITLLR